MGLSVSSVRRNAWIDLLQVKTNMFQNGPSVDPLHFWPWKVKGQGKGHEIKKNKIIFSGNSVAYGSLQFTLSTDHIVPIPGASMFAVAHIAEFLVLYYSRDQ